MARPRSLVPLLLALSLASGLAPLGAQAQDRDMRQMVEAGDRAREAWPKVRERLLEGDVPGSVALMRTAVKRYGWAGKLAVGNMTWVMHPAESRALHEEALAESKGERHVRLEVALHHTRANECDAALADWTALRGDTNVPPHMGLLEAYCHLRRGDDAAAVAAYDRAGGMGWRNAGAYAGLVNELWGERPAIAVYADRMGEYRRGDAGADLQALLQAAAGIDDPSTQWDALQRVADMAATREGAASPQAAELACLRPWFQAEAKRAADEADDPMAGFGDDGAGAKRRTEALARCKILVEGQPFPVNLGLGRALLSWMVADGAEVAPLLAQHAAALQARAEAGQGDVLALEILAALQSMAKDADAVAASDVLGWQRFGGQTFAESRVVGLTVKDMEQGKALAPATLAALDAARRQFPDSAVLLWLDVTSGRATGDARMALLRQWVLAEHRSPPTRDPLHANLVNPRLAEAWAAWRKAQPAR